MAMMLTKEWARMRAMVAARELIDSYGRRPIKRRNKRSARGNEKRLLRAATRERIRLEREASRGFMKWGPATEGTALDLFKPVPSVFAIAERLAKQRGKFYMRPQWASDAWGAR